MNGRWDTSDSFLLVLPVISGVKVNTCRYNPPRNAPRASPYAATPSLDDLYIIVSPVFTYYCTLGIFSAQFSCCVFPGCGWTGLHYWTRFCPTPTFSVPRACPTWPTSLSPGPVRPSSYKTPVDSDQSRAVRLTPLESQWSSPTFCLLAFLPLFSNLRYLGRFRLESVTGLSGMRMTSSPASPVFIILSKLQVDWFLWSDWFRSGHHWMEVSCVRLGALRTLAHQYL